MGLDLAFDPMESSLKGMEHVVVDKMPSSLGARLH